MVAPRIGGGDGDDDTAWVGGPSTAAKALSRPASILARRPNDFKSASSIEKSAVEGLSEERSLGADDKTSKIPLTTWINSIREYMEARGMDSVFRIHDRAHDSEVYLLVEWGQASPTLVRGWVNELRKGVGRRTIAQDGTVTMSRLGVCTYDQDNLKWSGKAIRNSITLQLWETMERALGLEATGPEVFAWIVNKLQQSSASSVRAKVKELTDMNLKSQPGQNVEVFGDRLIDLCRRIEGTGGAPRDLASLVAVTFIDSDVLPFNIEAMRMHNLVDKDPKAMAWQDIVEENKEKYRSLVSQSLWTPKDVPQPKDNVPGYFAKRTCHRCGSEDHLVRDCDEPPAPNEKNRGERDTKPAHWTRVGPKNGEALTKSVAGSSYSWCARCRRWQTGSKQHETSQHVSKFGQEAPAPPPAPAPVPAPPLNGNGGSANMVQQHQQQPRSLVISPTLLMVQKGQNDIPSKVSVVDTPNLTTSDEEGIFDSLWSEFHGDDVGEVGVPGAESEKTESDVDVFYDAEVGKSADFGDLETPPGVTVPMLMMAVASATSEGALNRRAPNEGDNAEGVFHDTVLVPDEKKEMDHFEILNDVNMCRLCNETGSFDTDCRKCEQGNRMYEAYLNFKAGF